MKRFLLFAGNDYYPSGGMEDFVSDFEFETDAIKKAKDLEDATDNETRYDYTWSHIYDSDKKQIIWHGKDDDV